MRDERRILVNATTFTLAEIFGQLANFAFVAAFARAFGIGILAQYSLGMAVGALLAVLVDGGTIGLLTRETSRAQTKATVLVGIILPIQISIALLLWIAGTALSTWLLGAHTPIVVQGCACGYQIFLRMSTFLLASFVGAEKGGWVALAGGAHRLLALGFGGTAIFFGAGPGLTASALIISALFLILLALMMFVHYFGAPIWRIAPAEAVAHMRRASAFFGLTMINVVYARGGVIILSVLASRDAVGLYAVADRIIVGPALLTTMFVNAVFPTFSRLADGRIDNLSSLTTRCARLLLVGTITLATLLTLLSTDIVTLLFGRAYAPASIVLLVMALALPVDGLRQLFSAQLLAMDRRSELLKARTTCLIIFSLSCPYLIIAGFGITAPAWAELLSDICGATWVLLLLRRSQSTWNLIRTLVPILLAGSLTIGLGETLLAGLAPLTRALTTPGVMIAALLMTGSVRMHDLIFLSRVIRHRDVSTIP